ncbi:MAG: helix-turn-helix domain-containing protein [Anaerolineales bacterium]|nr:helix-turn-helix domain-containing protein [Anaerolineales bacterium]
MTMKPGTKYFPLFRYLRQQEREDIRLTFENIEAILDAPLPASARERRGFWSNREEGAHQAQAWMKAGYRVESIDLGAGEVRFQRRRSGYIVKREQGSLRWDADSIRALRDYLDMNQGELAQLLGVRQQTVSEWETSAYQPTRSSSKHLTLIAEKADFPYQVDEKDQESRA